LKEASPCTEWTLSMRSTSWSWRTSSLSSESLAFFAYFGTLGAKASTGNPSRTFAGENPQFAKKKTVWFILIYIHSLTLRRRHLCLGFL
jgi:hypothetical protein